MTMQVMATGFVGSEVKEVQVNGQTQNRYSFVHGGLTGNPIIVHGMVTPGSAEDQKLETFRSAAERAKAGEGNPVRVRFGGVNATTRVSSELLPNGKAQGAGTTEGVVHKVPGVDCILTSVRQTLLDTTLEPEEFTCTVVGKMEKGKYAIRDVDLMQAPLQEGVQEGFHLRITAADYDSDAAKVLKHPQAQDGAYFLSGHLVRDLNEEASIDKKTGNAIAPWDRVALKVVSVFPIVEQNMMSAKERMGAVATSAAADPDRFNNATAAEGQSTTEAAPIAQSVLGLL